jgi:hypothetical protein
MLGAGRRLDVLPFDHRTSGTPKKRTGSRLMTRQQVVDAGFTLRDGAIDRDDAAARLAARYRERVDRFASRSPSPSERG